jgi:uroporphyrinogen-III synthase
LVVRADRGSDVLSTQLYNAGVEFRQIVVYQSFDVEVADRRVLGDLTMGDFDWVTVTSSAIARATVKLFGQHLEQTKLVSISPATSGQLETLGFSPAAEAKQYNMRGVFQSIVNFESSGN